MQNDDQQFNLILDEALAMLSRGKTVDEVLLLFPNYTNELSELLTVSQNISEHSRLEKAKTKFRNTLLTLPTITSMEPIRKETTTPFSVKQFFYTIYKKLTPQRLIVIGSCLLVFAFVTTSLAQFALNQLLVATSSAPDYQTQDVGCVGGAGGICNLGIEYPQSTGLSSQDIRAANPIAKGAYFINNVLQSFESEKPYDDNYAANSNNLNTQSLNDTREFLKTDYFASLRTRTVMQTATRVQTIVRGYGGRIDTVSSDNRYARISFVVPKDTFEQFKNEIGSLIGPRFYAESITQENLLPQKQVIENQTTDSQNALQDYMQNKKTKEASHAAFVKNFNASIARLTAQINALDNERSQTTSTNRLTEIAQTYYALTRERSVQQAQLAEENKNFARDEAYFNNAITATNSQLNVLDKQNQNVLNTVATVRGTIDISWISVHEVLSLFVPYYWLWLLGVALVVAYIRQHNKRAL